MERRSNLETLCLHSPYAVVVCFTVRSSRADSASVLENILYLTEDPRERLHVEGVSPIRR